MDSVITNDTIEVYFGAKKNRRGYIILNKRDVADLAHWLAGSCDDVDPNSFDLFEGNDYYLIHTPNIEIRDDINYSVEAFFMDMKNGVNNEHILEPKFLCLGMEIDKLVIIIYKNVYYDSQ